MGVHVVRWLQCILLVTVALPATAGAQEVATTFEQLRYKVKPGDTVYVTDRSGAETRARLLDISGSALVVRVDGRERELDHGDVRQIRQRLPDPLWTGAVIGLGIGAALGILAGSYSEGGAAGPALTLAGAGAGIGVGVDALIKGRKTIYRSADSQTAARILVAPLMSSTTRGGSVTFRF